MKSQEGFWSLTMSIPSPVSWTSCCNLVATPVLQLVLMVGAQPCVLQAERLRCFICL